MSAIDRQVTGIREALEREAARRFDAERAHAGLIRRSASITVHADRPRHGAGPLGRLPAPAQWATLAAALLAVALGVRGLWLERAGVERPRPATPAPAAAPALPLRPIADDGGAPTQAAPHVPPSVSPPVAPVPARVAPPDRERVAQPPPGAPATQRAPEPRPPVVRLAPSEPAREPAPAPPRRPAPAVDGYRVGPPVAAPSDAAGPPVERVGGVEVESLRIGTVELEPEVREVREIGATLVLPLPAAQRGSLPHPATPTAPPQGGLGDETSALRPATLRSDAGSSVPSSGAYYTRLFVGTTRTADRRAHGFMSETPQIVPLHEREPWGDEDQQHFLRRTFALDSVIAVDGSCVPSGPDAPATENRYIASADGRLFEVALRAEHRGNGLHALQLRVSRGRPEHPDPSAQDFAADLVLEQGRVAILGLPTRADARPTAFLAVSARFDREAPRPDVEEVLGDDDGVQPPLLVYRPAQEYAPFDRGRRLEGRLTLEVVVRKDGTVDRAQVLRISPPRGAEQLIEAATRTVRSWRYLPARRAGRAVHARILVDVEFATHGVKS